MICASLPYLPLSLLLLLVIKCKTEQTNPCPELCQCISMSQIICRLEKFKEIQSLIAINVTEILIDAWPPDTYIPDSDGLIHSLQRLSLPSTYDSAALESLFRNAPNLSMVRWKSEQAGQTQLPKEFLLSESIRHMIIESQKGLCNYGITRHNIATANTCKRTCTTKTIQKLFYCVCEDCSTINSASIASIRLRSTNGSDNNTALYNEKYPNSLLHAMVIGTLGVVTLLVNFIFVAHACVSRPMTPLRVFSLGLFLFDCCIAEYGIAVAAYLTQEDEDWGNKFCSAVVSVKIFGISAAVFALFLMTYQKVITSDTSITRQDLIFKSIVYVLEGMVIGGMLGIIAWTKLDKWDYLCEIVYPHSALDKILISIEATCYICITILLIRYPYHKFKHCRDTKKEVVKTTVPANTAETSQQSAIQANVLATPLPSDKDFPIFVIVFITTGAWCLTYLVTIPAIVLTNSRQIAFIRACALLIGAMLHPLLFTIRQYIRCDCFKFNCRRVQNQGRISSQSSFYQDHNIYKRGHRRRSLSLDDLKLPKTPTLSLDIFRHRKITATSKSYPLLSSPIDEEETDGGTIMDDQTKKSVTPASPSMPEFLTTFLHGNLSSNGGSPEIMYSNERGCGSLPLINNNELDKEVGKHVDSKPNKDRKISLPLKIVVIDTAQLDKRKSLTESDNSILSSVICNDHDRNRISRVPTFIPFDEPGPSGVPKQPDNLNKSQKEDKRAPLAKFSYSTELDKEGDNEDDLDIKIAEKRPLCCSPIANKKIDKTPSKESKQNNDIKKKHRKGNSSRGKGKRSQPLDKEQRAKLLTNNQASISLDSLEWDPVLSSSNASSPTPEDEDTIASPIPSKCPSKFATDVLQQQSRNSGASIGSGAARNSSYSMDWDPTSVQKVRDSISLPCEWEPYSVDEPSSNGETSTDQNSPPKKTKNDVVTTENL